MGWVDLAIATFRENDYSVNVWFITKNENIYRMKGADLSDKTFIKNLFPQKR